MIDTKVDALGVFENIASAMRNKFARCMPHFAQNKFKNVAKHALLRRA
jgi:hypothetical protein